MNEKKNYLIQLLFKRVQYTQHTNKMHIKHKLMQYLK